MDTTTLVALLGSAALVIFLIVLAVRPCSVTGTCTSVSTSQTVSGGVSIDTDAGEGTVNDTTIQQPKIEAPEPAPFSGTPDTSNTSDGQESHEAPTNATNDQRNNAASAGMHSAKFTPIRADDSGQQKTIPSRTQRARELPSGATPLGQVSYGGSGFATTELQRQYVNLYKQRTEAIANAANDITKSGDSGNPPFDNTHDAIKHYVRQIRAVDTTAVQQEDALENLLHELDKSESIEMPSGQSIGQKSIRSRRVANIMLTDKEQASLDKFHNQFQHGIAGTPTPDVTSRLKQYMHRFPEHASTIQSLAGSLLVSADPISKVYHARRRIKGLVFEEDDAIRNNTSSMWNEAPKRAPVLPSTMPAIPE